MSIRFNKFKCVVAAFCLALGFSNAAGADEALLDQLFTQLESADLEDAARIELQIRAEWSKSGSPSIDLLLRRGKDALDSGDALTASEHFTAAIDHDPSFAEAYSGRSIAYYQLGLTGPALDDLRQTLVLNPRHFGAMRGFALILEELGRAEDALEVYEQVLALYPSAPGINEAVDRLKEQFEGRSL